MAEGTEQVEEGADSVVDRARGALNGGGLGKVIVPGALGVAPAAADTAEHAADLATELRGAAGDLAETLLDRATDRLERTKP